MTTPNKTKEGIIKKPRTWSWLLLFTTSSTLLCCAMPMILVTVGLGAAVATMASSAPWLITLSYYKNWVFLISGLLIALSAWAVYRSTRACPTDPELAAACQQADTWNKRFIWASTMMWFIGFLSTYVLPLIGKLF